MSQSKDRKEQVAVRRDKVVQLFRRGLTYRLIAEKINVPLGVVTADVFTLQQSGVLPNRRPAIDQRLIAVRRRRVLALHREGVSCQCIAEQLKVSRTTVFQDLDMLRCLGRVPPLVDRQQRKQEVIALYNAGKQRSEIADTLGISVSTVSAYIYQLRKSGAQLVRRKPGPLQGTRLPGTQEKWQRIAALRRQGKTYGAIGTLMGLTGERVRQILSIVETECGADATAMPLSLSTAAHMVGVSLRIFRRVVAERHIPLIPYKNSALINSDDLEHLIALDAFRKRCANCGTAFPIRSTHQKYCSRKCAKAVSVERSKQPTSSEMQLTGWRREAYRRLCAYTRPDDDQWVTMMMARRLTGLTAMQVYYLRVRGVLSVRAHPTKRGKGGKPVNTFAVSELRIIQEVITAHLRGQQATTE